MGIDQAAARSASELLARYKAGEREFADSYLIGAHLGSALLRGASLRGAGLRGAILRGANLSSADLRGATMSNANLRGANLHDAILCGADLAGADLGHANLSGADLTGANLTSATLQNANLRNANLTCANLAGLDLSGADLVDALLTEAVLGDTLLSDVDLAPICQSPVNHVAASIVDFRSIVRSLGAPHLKEFLRRTGLPDVFVEYMVDCARSLSPELVFSLLQSTFISYGGPDEGFARKLNNALERRGVTTFFFKEHAIPGDKLHRVMRNGVNEHERTILICSESSLQRPGLLNELEETLAREARDGGRAYLIPVRLDDYVINGWKPKDPDVAQAVRDRVIADFRDHEDPARFDAELAKLVAALKKPVA